MKKLLLLSILLLAVTTQAQEPFWFAGAEYDSEEGWMASGGRATPLGIGGLYLFPRTAIDIVDGVIGIRTIEADLAHFWQPKSNIFVGLVAGPDADWVSDTPSEPIAYITASAGVAGGYYTGKYGIGGAFKYTFGHDQSPSGWRGWAGLSFSLSGGE